MTFSEFQRSGTLRKTLVEPTSHSEFMAYPTGEDHCCAPGSPPCSFLVGSVAKTLGYSVLDVTCH